MSRIITQQDLIGTKPAELDPAQNDFQWSKMIAEKLHEHYPGHLWAVRANSAKLGGVVEIKNMAITNVEGYLLLLSEVYADPSMKCIVRAGGELLERAGLKRGAADMEEIFSKPRDLRNNMIGSDL